MKIRRAFMLLSLSLLAIAVVGCASEDPTSEADSDAPETPAPVAASPDYLALAQAAVAGEQRSEEDRADDAGRKPAEVVSFFEIGPGMEVLDLLCGDGYYAEVLSGVVGPEGRVVCHTNQPYVAFLGDAWGKRWADGRLPNVTPLEQEVEDLDLEPESFDAIVFVLGYHDTYYEPPDDSWPVIDNDVMLARLMEALRPGGVLGIVDHAAEPGGDAIGVATARHRIDGGVVKADLAAAGFVLEAEAAFLRNPEDDKSLDPFQPQTRRKTDRFVHRYRKPGA